MQNIILSYPNRVDGSTITGGNWLPALPAQNLANRELWKVARSTDAALASTKFSVDLGADRLLRCFALANHNFGPEARWKVKVLGEEGAENLCLYSEKFAESAWIKGSNNIVADQVFDPYGGGGAYGIKSNGTLGNLFLSQSILAIEPGPHTWSAWVMCPNTSTFPANGRVLTLRRNRGGEVVQQSILMSASGLISGEWLRLSVTMEDVAIGDALTCFLGYDFAPSGDTTSTLYIYAAQLESGLSPLTYKPTTSSPSNIALLYSSQWQDAWQMAFDNLVEWESTIWWTGTAGDEYYRSPYPALLAMPDFITGRYVTVEIDDTANPDGYVQIGRLFAGGGIHPATNASYGLQDSWRDLSTMDASESGSAWATERRRLRGVSFVIDHLTLSEAAYIHEMQRLLGTVKEVLYLPYPDDLGESQRYGFIGSLSELSAIEYPYFNARSSAFKIEEIG